MLKRKKKVRPIKVSDVTIIDDSRLKKAITAASLGNAMEWFDFGVYGFVAYALGKVFFPDASPSVQMIAALGTFSVPFLIRPLGGLFFGMLGDKYGPPENPVDNHHHHVIEHLLYWPDPVVRDDRYLGANPVAACKNGAGFLGGRRIHGRFYLRGRILSGP